MNKKKTDMVTSSTCSEWPIFAMTLVCRYGQETKQRSLYPKATQVQSNVQGMLIVFLTDGFAHHKFISPDQTVSQKYYTDVLCHP